MSVNLSSLELIPVDKVAKFHMSVDNSASAELSVSVTGKETYKLGYMTRKPLLFAVYLFCAQVRWANYP